MNRPGFHPDFRGRGFTLIEVLAATTIGALLMVSLMRVTVMVRKDQEQLQESERDPRWVEHVFTLIERDLQSGSILNTGNNTLSIETTNTYDRGTWQLRQHPAVVSYRLADEETGLLIRTQRDRTDPAVREDRQLLAAGVSRWLVKSLGESEEEDADASPVAIRIEIHMGGETSSPRTYQRTLLLR